MNLFTFLDKQSKHTTPVTFFSAKHEVPLLIFCLGRVLARSEQMQFLDVSTLSTDQLQAHLSMSFLGSSTSLWLTHSTQMDTASLKNLIKLLQSYSGPNTVFCFILSTKQIKEAVTLPEIIDYESFGQLWHVLYPGKKMNKELVKLFFAKQRNIPVDQACLLMNYVLVLGKKTKKFIDEWLPEIIEPDYSLFLLSGYLFAKQYSLFFSLWYKVKQNYAEPFWTAFWSERFFRAYAYKKYMDENNINYARKVGFRLPFSFLNKDYKKIQLHELMQLHNELASIDYRIKNGIFAYFELVFFKYCMNEFRKD